MSRIAWFSPLPPSTSGIAAYSAELLPLLRGRYGAIDSFTEMNAHEFVWQHRRRAYDLTIFQVGNAACHDYMWAYLFRYPGLVVLHDAQVHQARALFLTNRWKPRRDDYIAEFQANHPDAPRDVALLVAAGLGGSLYHHWPLTRLIIENARVTVVHNARLAAALREQHPSRHIAHVEMGVAAVPLDHPRFDVRQRHELPPDALIVAAFGGITPEKRIPQLMRAISALAERHPQLHLLLVGGEATHYDVLQDAQRCGVGDRVHVTGYVADDDLPVYLRGADICACLRWPTNRETSASWLRCLAAGRPTLVTELSHLADVPTIDPRGWRAVDVAPEPRTPVACSIDLLDEEHSLQLALDRLATDASLRQRLGEAAYGWWDAHHRLAPMADAYDGAVAAALDVPAPRSVLPAHLENSGSGRIDRIVADLGLGTSLDELLR